MKIKEGFELRDVCGEYVIVATGRKNIDFSKVVSLNESAAFVWRSVVGKDFTAQDVVKLLLEQYEVSEAQVGKDVTTLLGQWAEIGLLEE